VTIVVALACVDGVILASDSQGTEGDNSRRTVQKVFPLTDTSLWAASGSGAIIQDIAESIQTSTQLASSPRPENSLLSLVKPVLKRHYDNFLPAPGAPPVSPMTDVLSCGMRDGKPWIYEIDRNCVLTCYTNPGFHTIGSAALMAQLASELMAHFELPGKPLPYGLLVAYRSLDAIIRRSAFGVGGDIQMWVVDATGQRRLDANELRALRDRVEIWRSAEIETLEELMAGAPAPEGEPLPPPIGD
jgi:proteasome beta subunit